LILNLVNDMHRFRFRQQQEAHAAMSHKPPKLLTWHGRLPFFVSIACELMRLT